MQYLVRATHPNASTGNEEKIFNTLKDAFKHIQKIASSEGLFIGDEGERLRILEGILRERLSTVALRADPGERNQWIITAF
jgi:hypothetical protein